MEDFRAQVSRSADEQVLATVVGPPEVDVRSSLQATRLANNPPTTAMIARCHPVR